MASHTFFCDGEQKLEILVLSQNWTSFSLLLHLPSGEINMEEFVAGCLRYDAFSLHSQIDLEETKKNSVKSE